MTLGTHLAYPFYAQLPPSICCPLSIEREQDYLEVLALSRVILSNKLVASKSLASPTGRVR
jgi:hypothetical protein